MKPELLAPCHDFATLKAAITSGADAVYFGVKKYNMRMKAGNFSEEELPEIVSYCHKKGVKAYLTVNVIIYEEELREARSLLIKAKESGVDAVIIHDIGALRIARELGLITHVSTQASISNSVEANEYARLGASRVILARELNLKQIKEVAKKSRIPVEVFIHGAMCVSISGRCFFSQAMYGKSANRGECYQPCRQEWTVRNRDGEFIYDGERFLNSKDLCMIEHIPELISTGAKSFKIEGRMKDANYVSTVVSVYREAIDNFNKNKIKEWLKRLSSVFNRGFSTGFYYNNPEEDLKGNGNQSSIKKEYVGEIINYYSRKGVAELLIKNNELIINDEVIIENSFKFIKQKIKSMESKHKKITKAIKGEIIGLKVKEKTSKGMQVYKLVNTNNY